MLEGHLDLRILRQDLLGLPSCATNWVIACSPCHPCEREPKHTGCIHYHSFAFICTVFLSYGQNCVCKNSQTSAIPSVFWFLLNGVCIRWSEWNLRAPTHGVVKSLQANLQLHSALEIPRSFEELFEFLTSHWHFFWRQVHRDWPRLQS